MSTEPSRFAEKLVLVTGAGSGIGRETAFAFTARGANLVLADVDERGLDRTAILARDLGARVDTHIVDVSDRIAMANFADEVHGAHGPVDILVNNAGVGLSGSTIDTSLDDWEWVLGVNLMGVVYGCTLFGNPMAEARRGHIVNVASGAAYLPSGTLPAYGTSKAGVLALSQNLRVDLAPRGVGVSAICPGIINTNIARTTRIVGVEDPERARRAAVDQYARRNYGPERVADAIVRATERNLAIVPVSPEARAGWIISRLSPGLARRIGNLQGAKSAR